MKRLLLAMIMTYATVSVIHAQDLQIHRTDGTIITIPLAAIDSLTFVESGSDFVCGVSTVADVDGNIYNTVLIGTQCWMKENLKTTKYRNGTAIEYPGTDHSAWIFNTTGAYSWNNNDINWKDSYGALYNWHAVNNANGLCPSGWHVPTENEWTMLTQYLGGGGIGGLAIAGGKMKSTRTEPDPHPRWQYPNTGANNESNWSGLPGGIRFEDGSSWGIGYYGYWWSSSVYGWYRFIDYEDGIILSGQYGNTNGLSVRCIKD